MSLLRRLFGVDKPIIAMLHLPAMPGQKPVERVLAHELQIQGVRFEQAALRSAFPQHVIPRHHSDWVVLPNAQRPPVGNTRSGLSVRASRAVSTAAAKPADRYPFHPSSQ